jgi:hypothetical protein
MNISAERDEFSEDKRRSDEITKRALVEEQEKLDYQVVFQP